MTGGGDQDWRGGRSRRGPDTQEEARPSWKKSRHTVAAAGRRRFRARILIPILLLSLLVAIAIYIWRGAQYVHTHFVVLDLITGSMDFDAAAVPLFPENPVERFSTRRVTQSRLPTLAFYESAAGADIDKAHAVVLYLQTLVLPGADGELRCLIRNSTPDLDADSRYEPLQKLRAALTAFHEQNPQSGIVLLIDTPELNADWRLGYVRSAILQELEEWTSQIPRLVVIAACPDDQSIASCGPGASGTTAFGHFASRGFSRLADTDKNNELSVIEYCQYVVQQTNEWVTRHRDQSGQIVQVLPAMDHIRQESSGLNIVLMKDLPEADSSVAFAADTVFQTDLARHWQLRDELHRIHAYRWNPMLWRAATEQLQRSETAFINGHSENSARALQRAKDLLTRLQVVSRDVCPDQNQLNARRDLSFKWFAELPSAPRIARLWESLPAPAGGSELPLAEQILEKHLNVFPFEQVGLKIPSESDRTQMLDRRRNGEVAAAELFGSVDRLRLTTSSAERQLLLSEDLSFVRSTPTDLKPDSADTLYKAIHTFADTMSEADATFCRALDTVSGMTRWCAQESSQLPEEIRKTWHELLLQNHADVEMTPEHRDQLLVRMETLPAAAGMDAESVAVQFRAAIFRLLINARGLQAALRIVEPGSGYTADRLSSVTDSVSAWNTRTLESLQAVISLRDQFCQELIKLDSQTATEQVRAYRLLRSALVMESIPATTRTRLLERLVRWDGKLKESTAQERGSDQTDPDALLSRTSSSTLSDADAILWMLQSINFLSAEAEENTPASSVWKTATALILESAAGDLRGRLSQFGSAVRNTWKVNRNFVKDTVLSAGPETFSLLRLADQRSRLMSGFDAELEVSRVPAERLLLLNRFQYCLLHIDRLLLSQWVDPNDRKPYATNGWYSQVLGRWLEAAEAAADALRSGSSLPAASLKQLLDERRAKLQSTESLQVLTVPIASGVELGDQNISRKSASIEIRHQNPAEQDGIASLLVTPIVRDTSTDVVRVDNNGLALSLRDRTDTAELLITRLGNPGGDGCQPIPLQTSVFFRGRRWLSAETLRVNPCAGAEFRTTRLARPATAALTVSGSDPRPITFILDWSESMKEPLSSQPGTLRAAAAVETLTDMIRSPLLAEARVSLDVFGHRIRYNGNTRKDEYNEPYRTIFRRPIPSGLNATTDLETMLRNLRVDANGKQTFISTLQDLERLEPFGITPLASAITRALNNLERRSGIVIAVTDGQASDVGVAVDKDDITRRRRQVENDARKETLKGLVSKQTTKVVIVAFDLQQRNAERNALNQVFQEDCGISVIDAVDKDQLLGRIIESLDQGKYLVSQAKSNFVQEVALNERTASLPAGHDYAISFGKISTPLEAPLRLAPGDELRINLDHQRQRLVFKRDVGSQMLATAEPTASMDQPSILRAAGPARFVDSGTVGSMPMAKVELTLMLDHQQEDRPVRQPAEIEFVVSARGATFRPDDIREQFSSDYGAPAWKLEIDAWPKEHDILVNAFWKMQPTPAETALSWEQLKAADRPETSLRIGGDGGNLPEVLVWTRLLENGTLQVRVDRDVKVPYSEENLPEDIRVQIGKRDVRERNATFLPDEVNCSCIRTESGSVIYEFEGNFSPDDLKSREIAFTSRKARQSAAFQLSSPLLIDKRR